MPRFRFTVVAGLALGLALPAAPLRAGDVEKAVDYRQALMNVYAFNATSMGDMVKGKTVFDRAGFARYANDLAAAAGLDMLAGFPEDSINEDSDATDAIWLDWDRFQKRYEAMKDASAKLAQTAAGGDDAAMREQFGATSRTCKACHDDFKD